MSTERLRRRPTVLFFRHPKTMVDECTSRNQRGCQWAVSVCDGEQRFFLFPLSMARRRKLFNIISLLPSTIPHRSTGKQRGMGATAELDDLIFCWNGSGPPWSMTWTSSSCLEMCLAQQWVRLGRVHLTINKFIASAMAWTPASRFFMCLAQEEVWLGGPHLVLDASGTTRSMTKSSPSCFPSREHCGIEICYWFQEPYRPPKTMEVANEQWAFANANNDSFYFHSPWPGAEDFTWISLPFSIGKQRGMGAPRKILPDWISLPFSIGKNRQQSEGSHGAFSCQCKLNPLHLQLVQLNTQPCT